jgi:predicted TIM-barrel fold metal-dependent hydrolase
LRHTTAREQFDMPLWRLGGMPASLASSWIDIEASRSLTYRAASAASRDPLGNLHLSSMAKVAATEAAGRVTDRAVQSMGRFGLVRGPQDRAPVPRCPSDACLRGIDRGHLRLAGEEAGEGHATVIIDSHVHVWPDHIAAVVTQSQPSGLTPMFDGTLAGVRRTLDECGVDRAMVLGVAAKASTVARTNEFIGSVPRDRLHPFGTVHPELSVEENLKHLADNGIRGVKLHPLFQALSFADPRVVDIVGALADEGIVIIAHAGAGGDAAANERGAPGHLRALIDRFPRLQLIACHFGGFHRLDEAEQELVGSRAFLETSWPPTVADVDQDRIRTIIARHGADRVVFGSDWPMANRAAEIAAIRALDLGADDEAAILGGNLARILGVAA